MGFIKFNVSMKVDGSGDAIFSKVKRIQSDMPLLSTFESNLIFHALSHKGGMTTWLELNEGNLDIHRLHEAEYFMLDEGMLNVDKLLKDG